MRTQLETAAPVTTPAALLRGLPLWLLAALAAGALGIVNLAQAPDRLLLSLGDTDDATRLLSVRELMAGAPWLDTTLARIGGSEPLVSHWSRLVDLPLALLMALLAPLLGAERAELVTRAAWPLIVLVPLVLLLARDAETRAGRLAALIAIGFALTCLSGLVQFLPGRIDHHNLQILAAVGGTLLLVRALDRLALAIPAGVLLGLGTAVGYEALLLTSATLALAGLTVCWTGRGLHSMARAAWAFAGTLAVAFAATTAPAQWLVVRCDALSGNLVVLAGVCAAALVLLAARAPAPPRILRLAILIGAGCAGLGLFSLAEPACLRGPFGQVDPRIVPIWLDGVVETHSIIRQASTHAFAAGAWVAFAAIGLLAAYVVLRPRERDRDALHGMIAMLAVALSLWQLKLIPYATFLLVPTLAVMVARLPAMKEVSAPVVRGGACLLLNQVMVTTAAVLALGALGLGPKAAQAVSQSAAPCLATRAVATLDRLPRGRFAGDIDLGPFIAALTRHDVLAAPYHRLGHAIRLNHALMAGPLEEARERMREAGTGYIAICPGLQRGGGKVVPGLRGELLAGRAPDWLERVELPHAHPIELWRLRDGLGTR